MKPSIDLKSIIKSAIHAEESPEQDSEALADVRLKYIMNCTQIEPTGTVIKHNTNFLRLGGWIRGRDAYLIQSVDYHHFVENVDPDRSCVVVFHTKRGDYIESWADSGVLTENRLFGRMATEKEPVTVADFDRAMQTGRL